MPTIERVDHLVDTACPLDCPDACHLTVGIRNGRVVQIDGGTRNPVTRGYICAKVRRFGDRVYGPDRLRYPMLRTGPKGSGQFRRVPWEEALEAIAVALERARDQWGPESILPYCYGGSNGLMTQDATDMVFFRRLGASRLLRTLCAAPTGAANMTLYGKMPSVSYQDYVHARLIVLWGQNPAVSGIHAMPYLKEARANGARLVVVDPRTTTLARQADLHLPIRPGTDVVVALAIHRILFEEGHADPVFLERHTTGADRLRAKAAEWTVDKAAEVAGLEPSVLRTLADWYIQSSPALVRCGWGLERNRNGGSAAMAVLALPAVANKFGVRGGGYAMSNSASWSLSKPWLDETPEPATRALNMNQLGQLLTEPIDPPVKALFVYNANPAATVPNQRRVLQGLEREDLFTVVFEQVVTDTVPYADVALPATTFLEGYDFAKAYGPMAMQLGRPVVDPVGEARSNADVFAALGRRLGVFADADGHDELELLVRVLDQLPADYRGQLRDSGTATPPWDGRPVQFVDVVPWTPDGLIHLWSEELDAAAPAGLYAYQPDPGSDEYPLALISPASDRTISSTLGELSRPEVRLQMHAIDAAARQLADGDDVCVWNALGEVRCRVQIGTMVRAGTVVLPKGLWRRHTANGFTATALAPDALTDLGGGACFNDARVEVRRVGASA